MGENVFSYFQTLFVVSPVSRHIYSYFRHKSVQKWEKMDFHFFPFLDTFCRFSCFQTPFLLSQTQKCLDMGENVFSHFQTLFVVSPFSRHFSPYIWSLFVVSPVSRHLFSYFQLSKTAQQVTLSLTNSLRVLLLLTYKERPQRPVTFETFGQSDEET